jgi:hypothetical protein
MINEGEKDGAGCLQSFGQLSGFLALLIRDGGGLNFSSSFIYVIFCFKKYLSCYIVEPDCG